VHASRSWRRRRCAWQLGVAAGRRGRSRGGQRGVGEGGSEVGKDAWKGSGRRGVGGSAVHGRDSGGGAAQRRNRGSRVGGGRQGLVCDFPKMQGSYYNVLITFKPELK
jgi:hypothetical protein